MAFPEEVYYNSPKFDFYYDRIKSILTTPDCQIVGFSLSNDAGFLATAYELYGKEPISFTYYDFQKLYQGYTKAKNRTSVEGLVAELQIPDITLHKSDDDSWAVVRALQIISEKEQLTLSETLKMLKKRNNDYRAERAKEHNLSLIEKINGGNLKAQNEFMKNFIHRLELSEEKKDDLFFCKSVCISSHFQKKRFNEFLAIIVKNLCEYAKRYEYTGILPEKFWRILDTFPSLVKNIVDLSDEKFKGLGHISLPVKSELIDFVESLQLLIKHCNQFTLKECNNSFLSNLIIDIEWLLGNCKSRKKIGKRSEKEKAPRKSG